MFDDDGKLKRKLSNKRVNASKENIGFNLSYQDICVLLDAANIKSSDWCRDKYHLARYEDKGDYILGNCRFIPMQDNIDERVTSDAMINAAIKNLKKVDPNKRKEAVINSPKWKSYLNERKEQSKINKENEDKNKHPSYKGNNNSQYGSSWYTNGKINIKIKQGESVPEGFYKGRCLKT